MKKIIQKIAYCITVVCFIFQSQQVIAGEKATVAFVPFAKSEKLDTYAMARVYGLVTTAFVNAKRFQIMEKGLINVAVDWSDYLKNEQFVNSEIAKQGNMKGAKILLVGYLSTVSVSASEDNNGWSSYISFDLKYVNVETGISDFALSVSAECKDIKEISNPLGGSPIQNPIRVKTPEEAISKALKNAVDKVDKWIKEKFPLERPIFDFEEDTKSKIYRVIVDGGTDVGFNKTMSKLYLVEKKCKLSEADNKTKCRYSEPLMELKIDRIENETTVITIKDKAKWDNFQLKWQETPEKERKKFIIVESIGR